jgi:hypothetical protein
VIVCFVDICRIVDHHCLDFFVLLIFGIVDHHCLEVIVCFVDICRIVDHHCLEAIVCFVDSCRIVDHHCLEVIVTILQISTKQSPLNSDGQQFYKYPQNKQ